MLPLPDEKAKEKSRNRSTPPGVGNRAAAAHPTEGLSPCRDGTCARTGDAASREFGLHRRKRLPLERVQVLVAQAELPRLLEGGLRLRPVPRQLVGLGQVEVLGRR